MHIDRASNENEVRGKHAKPQHSSATRRKVNTSSNYMMDNLFAILVDNDILDAKEARQLEREAILNTSQGARVEDIYSDSKLTSVPETTYTKASQAVEEIIKQASDNKDSYERELGTYANSVLTGQVQQAIRQARAAMETTGEVVSDAAKFRKTIENSKKSSAAAEEAYKKLRQATASTYKPKHQGVDKTASDNSTRNHVKAESAKTVQASTEKAGGTAKKVQQTTKARQQRQAAAQQSLQKPVLESNPAKTGKHARIDLSKLESAKKPAHVTKTAAQPTHDKALIDEDDYDNYTDYSDIEDMFSDVFEEKIEPQAKTDVKKSEPAAKPSKKTINTNTSFLMSYQGKIASNMNNDFDDYEEDEEEYDFDDYATSVSKNSCVLFEKGALDRRTGEIDVEKVKAALRESRESIFDDISGDGEKPQIATEPWKVKEEMHVPPNAREITPYGNGGWKKKIVIVGAALLVAVFGVLFGLNQYEKGIEKPVSWEWVDSYDIPDGYLQPDQAIDDNVLVVYEYDAKNTSGMKADEYHAMAQYTMFGNKTTKDLEEAVTQYGSYEAAANEIGNIAASGEDEGKSMKIVLHLTPDAKEFVGSSAKK